jgi:hypothetical protein
MRCKPYNKIMNELSVMIYIYNIFRNHIIKFYTKIYNYIIRYFRRSKLLK